MMKNQSKETEIINVKPDVDNRYFFFFEGEEDGFTFEITAKNHVEAFDKAYSMWGPQVEDMFYRIM